MRPFLARHFTALANRLTGLQGLIPELGPEDRDLLAAARGLSMTSPIARWEFIQAVRYIEANGVPGDIVECGVWRGLRASVAAAARVRQLDPAANTSVQYSYLFLNDEENAIQSDAEDSPYVRAIVELQRGRAEEALAHIAAIPRATPIHSLFVAAMEAIAQGRNDDAVDYSSRVYAAGFRDPEGLCLGALVMTHAGAYDRALDTIEHTIDAGFMCAYLRSLPWMAPLVGNERFERLMAKADEGRRRAAAAFTDAGGDRLLGVIEA